MSEVYPRRAYAGMLEVHCGDVVRLLDGQIPEQHEPPAFSDCLVVFIAPGGVVELARPHVALAMTGEVELHVERFHVDLERLVDAFQVCTTGQSGRRDNRLRDLKPYFTVLLPWCVNGSKWHPTERSGPFSVLSRGAFTTREQADAWAAEHLDGAHYWLRYIDPMAEPQIAADFEQHTEQSVEQARNPDSRFHAAARKLVATGAP